MYTFNEHLINITFNKYIIDSFKLMVYIITRSRTESNSVWNQKKTEECTVQVIYLIINNKLSIGNYNYVF